ncbi:MAG: prepilin-type N-terminal cleavage/methylation domain-containing protein [Nitrospirae bacterium]|nr:prepilin-type N-terminal cleavage/methylation domain-containing protein [Nitrospirota bacterium]
MKSSKFKVQSLKLRNKGLTLIEVLIALTILSIGLLGVALMQVTSISGGMFGREMAVSTTLGQDILEKLRTLEYTSLNTDNALLSGSHPDSTDVSDGLAVGADSANITDERGQTTGPLIYTRTWTVTDNTPAANMKTITVTISWTAKGAVHSIIMTGVKVRS